MVFQAQVMFQVKTVLKLSVTQGFLQILLELFLNFYGLFFKTLIEILLERCPQGFHHIFSEFDLTSNNKLTHFDWISQLMFELDLLKSNSGNQANLMWLVAIFKRLSFSYLSSVWRLSEENSCHIFLGLCKVRATTNVTN